MTLNTRTAHTKIQSYRLWWGAGDQCHMVSISKSWYRDSWTIQLKYTFETKQERITVSYHPTLSHMPHCFEGVRIMFMNRPWVIQVLVMNIHNPFMHCATSQYVFKTRDVIMLLMRAVTIVAAQQQHRPPHRYHVASLWMACFTKTQQRNGTNCEFEKYVTTSNFFVLNPLDKSPLNCVCTRYVCDKSENARVCAKW